MKMTFDVPATVAEDFKRSVPLGQRSSLVTRFMAAEARKRLAREIATCRKVNAILKKDCDLKEWERFDDSE